jgi:hypothetical protein
MPASVAASDGEEETQSQIYDIEMLTAHGINAADVKKLKSAGYFSVGVR